MTTDPIGDMFTRLRNANSARHERVDMPSSNLKKDIAHLLKEEGYIADYKILTERRQKILRVFFKYMPDKSRVMQGVRRVSRPGLRIYRGCDDLPRVSGGLGMAIISTSKGLLSDKQSRQQKLGGEVLGYIW
ncbi:MAG TPA: 30S ribosomal protein S8 [Elusimicrobiota bacterium]|nr:30S ribosomal protein S8 [Elusimicrobiota bacterium]